MHTLGADAGRDVATTPREDASVTLGGVRLTRVQGGWIVETDAPVDLAELDAAVQWAKHAPAVTAPTPSEPLVSVDGVVGDGGVADARDLLADHGGFGADVLSGEDSVFGPDAEQDVVDVDAVRLRVSRLSFLELEILCEETCAVDKDNAVLEMILEERIGRMLRDVSQRFSSTCVIEEQIQRVTFWHGGVSASNLAVGVAGVPLIDKENPEREGQYKAALRDVEYVDDVRIFLSGRRAARDVGRAFASWSDWRAGREDQRACWRSSEEEDEEDQSGDLDGEADSTI